MKVNLKEASELMEVYVKAGLVPFLHSSPGIGKSDSVRAFADKYALKVIDLRLSQCDPTDLSGLISHLGDKCGYKPMDTFPLETDEVPEGYNGWCLFFDEMNSASRATQAASYKIVLDRMIGQKHLHKKVAIVCAGNLDTDNAIVESMSTALQSRMCHIEVDLHVDTWLNHAYEKGVHHLITSYIAFKPSSLYSFNPNHSDKTFACPRTWFFVDKLLKVNKEKHLLTKLISGAVSEGIGREFVSFMKIEDKLPKFKDICTNPTGSPVPDEPSTLYALSGSIAEHCDVKSIEYVIDYIARMPIENQVVCLRKMIKKDINMLSTKAVTAWRLRNQNVLF
jgi:hypothetical protein